MVVVVCHLCVCVCVWGGGGGGGGLNSDNRKIRGRLIILYGP